MAEVEDLKVMPEPKQHTDALFNGISPHFTKNIIHLNKTYFKNSEQEAVLLEEAVKSISVGGKFQSEVEKFQTSDEYTWFRAYQFTIGEGENKAIIAFPHKKDVGRSVAIYAEGEVGPFTGHSLVAQISGILQNLQRMQG